MILARALTLAAEVRRLTDDNRRLSVLLAVANAATDEQIRRNGQLQRDLDLLALMARDRPTALGFLRDAHRIDRGEVA